METARIDPDAIDRQFIDRDAAGYKALLYAVSWEELELQSGMLQERIRALAEIYRKSRSAIISWRLGVTQQEHGVDTLREIVNVLLLREISVGRERGLARSRALERFDPLLVQNPPFTVAVLSTSSPVEQRVCLLR